MAAEAPNRFELVSIVRKRAQQIRAGAEPLVFPRSNEKLVTTALREFEAGEIGWKRPE